RAANNLALTFTGPLARSLALVAIVIGGLMFMFGEGGAKRQISGIVFGGGLALFAGQVLAWLFWTACSERKAITRFANGLGHAPPPDIPSGLQGSPSAAYGLRGGSSPLLPRAGDGRGNLQPVLLLPGGAAYAGDAVRVRAVGDQPRSADATDPPVVVTISPALRRDQALTILSGGVLVLSISRILRGYHDAGSVNSLIALWGFLDDHTFLTKAGHVGVVFRLKGVDYECLDLDGRREVVHRFEAALRVLDDHCRVYEYLYKRRVEPF